MEFLAVLIPGVIVGIGLWIGAKYGSTSIKKVGKPLMLITIGVCVIAATIFLIALVNA